MHLAMITAYFIEHMFGFSRKQKAGSSQMVPALLSLILISIIQYYDVRGKSPDMRIKVGAFAPTSVWEIPMESPILSGIILCCIVYGSNFHIHGN